MNKKNSKKITFGVLAALLSVTAYLLGSAPFTPAILLVAVSAPMAITAILIKVWRLGLLALYFSIFAVLASPIFGLTLFGSGNMFLGVALTGAVLALALWLNWQRSTKVT